MAQIRIPAHEIAAAWPDRLRDLFLARWWDSATGDLVVEQQ